MKIITDDAVYVQRKDIIELIHLPFNWSESLCEKVFNDLFNNDQYTFIEFNDIDAICFFKDFEYIADYNKMNDLSDEEINILIKKIEAKRRDIKNVFTSMSEEERKNSIDMVYQDELLSLNIVSLKDLLAFRKGRIHFELPEGIPNLSLHDEENKYSIKRLLK